jgi:hypothetical protein
MATVTGLNGNRYYVNNPIWVKVDTTGDSNNQVTLNISKDSDILYSAKYYTLNNIVHFDLSEIMKGLLPEPNHPKTIVSGQSIKLAEGNFSIDLPNFNVSRSFLRGGEYSDRENIEVPNNAILSESEKIPVWTGYPSAKYYFDINGISRYTEILTTSESEKRRVISCNPVFLRFLNTKGGYSFWLFDEWEINKSSKQGTIVERRVQNLDLGLTTEGSINLSTKADTRYINTLNALLSSSEIYIYNIKNVLVEDNPQFIQSNLWTRVYNSGGKMKWNNFDSVHEFDFKLDFNFKNNSTLIW